jgi:hypothetical protein
MLQALSLSLYETLLKSFPANRDYVEQDFRQAPMPAPIAHFLHQTLIHRLHHSLEGLSSPWFDYQTEQAGAALNQLRQALLSTAHFPANEWAKALENATGIVLSYLVRPTHTLAGFIFGKDHESIDTKTMLRRMDYFSEYTYFKDIIQVHLDRKGLDTMTKDRFLDTVSQIDRLNLQHNQSAESRVALLQPLFNLFAVRQPQGLEKRVPTSVLAVFFQDKGESDLYRRLLFEDQMRSVTSISEAELLKHLAPQQILADLPSVPVDKSEKLPTAAPLLSASLSQMPTQVLGQMSGQPQALWQQFQQSPVPVNSAPVNPVPVNPVSVSLSMLEDTSGGEEEQAANNPASGLPPSQMTVNQMAVNQMNSEGRATPPPIPDLSLKVEKPVVPIPPIAFIKKAVEKTEDDAPAKMNIVESASDTFPPTPVLPSILPSVNQTTSAPDSSLKIPVVKKGLFHKETPQERLRNEIDQLETHALGVVHPERRIWFLRTLFDNNIQTYHETLKKLGHARNWQEASQIIAVHVFIKHNIDIYSEAAVAFTDSIETQFHKPTVLPHAFPAR